MPVYLTVQPENIKMDNKTLEEVKKFADSLLKVLKLENLELSLVFTDDKTIRQLNREWRGKDKPTDVLSFPQDFPEMDLECNKEPAEVLNEVIRNCKGCKILGDIVISLDTAQKQAKDFDWSFENELKRLVLHGMVHLLGFDHEKSPIDEKKFREIENFLWNLVEKEKPFRW